MAFLNLFRNKQIAVSLSDQMCNHAAHGALWARKISEPVDESAVVNTGYTAFNFRADRPQLLVKPCRETIRSIYEQARDLGLELLHVEIKFGGETKIYGL